MRSDMDYTKLHANYAMRLFHVCLYSSAAEHHRSLAGTHFTVPWRVEGWVDLAEDKIAASNFARRFIGVQGRESHILGNIAPQKPKIGHRVKDDEYSFQLVTPRRAQAYSSSALATRSIGMCGYTADPKTNVLVYYWFA